jgi:hypothetical protein
MLLYIPTDKKMTAKVLTDVYLAHVFSKWGKPVKVELSQ